MRLLFKLCELLGVDRAVLFTLLNRVWSLISGLLSVVFIVKFISPEMQGFYYTFGSLLAIQMLFELGLTYSLTVYSAYEMKKLSWLNDNHLEGDEVALSRLSSLFIKVEKWFIAAAILFISVCMIIGFIIFPKHSSDISIWLYPWVTVVVFTAAKLPIIAFEGVLEGLGKVSYVARVRLFSTIIATAGLWIALLLGGGLYGLCISAGIIVVASCVIYFKSHGDLIWQFIKVNSTKVCDFDLKAELWSFQWRISLSWISGFFIFQIFNPVVFYFLGPVSAGQLGLGFAIVNAISSVTSAWISANNPKIAALTATHDDLGVRKFYFLTLTRVLFISVAASFFALFILTILLQFIPSLYNRIPDNLVLCFLMLATVLNQVIFLSAAFVRARKEEPYMVPSVLSALFTVLLLYPMITHFGEIGAAISYLLPILLIVVPFTFHIVKKRIINHEACII
ncbi:lipopolysaccharide biosynthesis protein [Aeromonas sp. 96A]|uniref:lipopolysaccharide biosynthesis protein n=1 Tax=Aeromonas sp. 96A TaxID=3452730 RepID=UPI003F79EAD4